MREPLIAGHRRPEWLRKMMPLDEAVLRSKERITDLGLHTICESARCPNRSDCFRAGNATFLLLGSRCTRGCAFCGVGRGDPAALDPEEGDRIAAYLAAVPLRYCVLTSVTRDDLPDGGASHFGRTVRTLRMKTPRTRIELLVPDFRGDPGAIEAVAILDIAVFGHNLETVRALYPLVRSGAEYDRSLRVLSTAKTFLRPGVFLKTGVMVGIGESDGDLEELFADCARVGVQILTIGQYLRPAAANAPVKEYYSPERFRQTELRARAAGIPTVVAGPYVRSSYLAEKACLDTEKDLTKIIDLPIIAGESP